MTHKVSACRHAARRRAVILAGIGCIFCVGGCTSGGAIDKGLDIVGLKRADSAASQRRVAMSIDASPALNTDAGGRALALVVRIYKLRAASQFGQAPYSVFTGAERPTFGDDIVAVEEVVLIPGQKHQATVTLPAGTTHVGVAALFLSPDMRRWRYVFEARQAERSGISLGAHACGLSVTSGDALGALPGALGASGMQCR